MSIVTDQQARSRQRRSWTAAEDCSLYEEVKRIGIYDGHSNDWNAVAARFPNRTNKDCRKRWMKICKSVNRGLWSDEEDDRLLQAIELYGQKWIEVARVVRTRHADQCAKRWQTALCQGGKPASAWTNMDDESLLQAVDLYGQKWKLIAEQYFHGKPAAVVRSRYAILTDISSQAVTDSEPISPPAEVSTMDIDAFFATNDNLNNFDMAMMSEFTSNNTELEELGSDVLHADAGQEGYYDAPPATPDVYPPEPSTPSSASTTSLWHRRSTLDGQKRDPVPTTLTLADVQPSTLNEVLNILIRDRVKVSVAING